MATKTPKKKAAVQTIVVDPYREERAARVAAFRDGRGPFRHVSKRRQEAVVDALKATRSTLPAGTWRSMEERVVSAIDLQDARTVIDPRSTLKKARSRAEYVGSYLGHNGVLRPEYDMLEPFVIYDTEAYLKQAINRKLSLMLRNGFAITSSDETSGDRYSKYIQDRLTTMEYATRRPVLGLIRDILYNMSLCSNCFLCKLRDADGSGGSKTKANDNKIPVAGYTIIPAHTLFPYLDKGVLAKWRRYYDTGMPYEDYQLDDIIHLKWDVKPGHIFGTPRTIAVRDDIFALRRLEENIELLFINHLFPLFHVKVGTPEAQCTYYADGSSEVDLIRQQIETMPKEGVFVTDERVEVAAVGAKGESLDTKELVAHLKGRVYTGLGMSPLDMGEGDTANRSTADNISQVLKDSIKADLDLFGALIRMEWFLEWFREWDSSFSLQKAVATIRMEWHEIDTDGRIKEENHAMTMYTNQMVTRTEGRQRMKLKPMKKEQEKDTHYERHTKDLETHKAKLESKFAEEDVGRQKQLLTHQTKEGAKQAETEMSLHKSEVEKEQGKARAAHVKASAQVKVLKARTEHAKVAGVKGNTVGGKKTAKNRKTAQNRNTPSNQHGTKNSPRHAQSSREMVGLLMDRLEIAQELCDATQPEEWRHLSGSAFDGFLLELQGDQSDTDGENSYTRQVRMGANHLRDLIAETPDLELLRLVLETELENEEDGQPPEMESCAADEQAASTLEHEIDPAGSGDPAGEDDPEGEE